MKRLVLVVLICGAPLAGCETGSGDDPVQSSELNANSRYTIESVHVSGLRSAALSTPLREDLNKVIGEKVDHPALEKMADRIKKELRVTDVSVNISRGAVPGQVVVDFAVTEKQKDFELNVAKFLFDSREGWNGSGEATTHAQGNDFTFGLVSDGDALTERFTGIRARFERRKLWTDRLRVSFEFDGYHEQWDNTTLAEAGPQELYRSRQMFTPEATLVLLEPLELDFGVNFARFQPLAGGAKIESSNAVVTSLRYHQRWGSGRDAHEQEARASYSLQASTKVLDTDSVFTRHETRAAYRYRHDRNSVEVRFLAGLINGNAPLFDRFTLGNAETLRGWNKFDLDPLGGSRMAHGSVDYHYRFLQVFYDAGAIWDTPQQREAKQSAGCGFRMENGIQVAVAFPLRDGHIDPIFYAGLNF